MAKTITQKITFKNASPKDLYDLYLDAKKHSAAIGAPVRISSKEGSKFNAHGGYISGKNLQLIKDRLIVQSWRAQDWTKSDIDSTLILYLESKGKDAVLHAIHANVPDNQVDGVDKGWHDYYWKPWKKYLAGKPILKPKDM